MKSNPFACLFLMVLLGGACSQKSDDAEANGTKSLIKPTEQLTALGQQYGCVLLRQEISKGVGTNKVFAFNIQQVLNANKKLAAAGRLIDLVQSGEHVQAVIELCDFDLGLWSLIDARECVAELECPTNLIPNLVSKRLTKCCFAFEAAGNQHSLKYMAHSSQDNDWAVLSSVIRIEGRLIAITELGVPKGEVTQGKGH